MGTRTRRKDGRIGDRITFQQDDDQLRVDIRQHIPPAQMTLLTAWLLLWCSLEAAVLYFWTQEPSEGNAALGYAMQRSGPSLPSASARFGFGGNAARSSP